MEFHFKRYCPAIAHKSIRLKKNLLEVSESKVTDIQCLLMQMAVRVRERESLQTDVGSIVVDTVHTPLSAAIKG